MDTSTINSLTQNEALVAGGVLGGMLASVTIIGVVWAVLQIVGWWKLFVKAGEPGWKSIIPIYNLYIAFKIVGIMPWWPIILFICSVLSGAIFPITFNVDGAITEGTNPVSIILTCVLGVASIVLEVVYVVKLAKAFKKGAGTAIAAFFFPNIVAIVLGFGKAKYDKKAAYGA